MNAMEQHQEQWYANVGRFAIAMGEIEWAAVQMLQWLPNAEFSPKDGLYALIDSLSKAIVGGTSDFEREIAICVDEASQLRPSRNSILHSAVRWQVAFEGYPEDAEIEVGPDFDVESLVPRFVSYVHDKKDPTARISLGDLEGHVASARDLSDRMWRIIEAEHKRRT